MRVTLDIPDRYWGELVDVADSREMKVGDMLTRSALALIPASTHARVRVPELVAAGLPDAVIAERLRVLKSFVADVRRTHGMKANRFERSEWNDEFARNRAAAKDTP